MSTRPPEATRPRLGVGLLALIWSILASLVLAAVGGFIWLFSGWQGMPEPGTTPPPTPADPLGVGMVLAAFLIAITAVFAGTWRGRAFAYAAAVAASLPMFASLLGSDPLLVLLCLPLFAAPSVLWLATARDWTMHIARERGRGRRARRARPATS